MGAGLVSFLFAIGATAWIFNKFQRSSGNNTRRSLVASGISGLVIFIALFIILDLLFK